MLIDLSHTIDDKTITYRGLPAPIICDFLSRKDSKSLYPEGTSFQIGKIEMVSNTGTYIDCPFHRYEDGEDISEVVLHRFADLPAVCLRINIDTNGLAIDAEHFKSIDVMHKAVLVHTGWSKHWSTETYFTDHPFLTEDAAIYLAESGAFLVGIDSHNIDDTRGMSRPVHSHLLAHGILIVEHLTNLHSLPEDSFLFSAVPPKIKGMGTFPVRAFAKILN